MNRLEPETPPRTKPRRRSFFGPSLELGSVAGIPIRVHWTFSLLLLWVAFGNFAATSSISATLLGMLFILVVFGCVVLHELGHALTALRYGIRTRSITLSPIGGLAALESSPRHWREEFWVTAAGPAVNAVIAALLLPFVILFSNPAEFLANPFGSVGGFVFMVFAANMMLVLFNLIPAFPMDGGRIFRSLLTPLTDRRRATRIAARAGQVCAVLMGLGGLFLSPFLILIAVFVFFAAAAERRSVEVEEALSGAHVADAMRYTFDTASHSDTIDEGIYIAMHSGQNTLPVMFNGQLLGLVTLGELIEQRNRVGGSTLLSLIVDDDLPYVSPTDELMAVYRKMQMGQREVVPVVSNHRLVGLLPERAIRSFLNLRAA